MEFHVGRLTINIFGLVAVDLPNSQLAVRSLGSAVTTREVVDHQTKDFITRHALKSGLNALDVGNGVAVKTWPSQLPNHETVISP